MLFLTGPHTPADATRRNCAHAVRDMVAGFVAIGAERVAAYRGSGVDQIVPLSLQTEVGHLGNYSFAGWPLRQDHARRG